jgi:hypothetical protein
MFSELYQYFMNELQTNDFMSAALLAGPASFLLYTARGLPIMLWIQFKRAASLEVRFNSDMPDYYLVQQIIASQVASRNFSRRFVYQTFGTATDEADYTDRRVHQGLTTGYGTTLGWFQGTLVTVNRSESDSAQTAEFKETLTLTFWTPRKSRIKAFADFIAKQCDRSKASDKITLRTNCGDYWRSGMELPKRSISTVFTEGDVGQEIVSAIRRFEDSKDAYRERGLPYHLGILLSGVPGTGKSSLIHAIASELGRSIMYLNLGGIEDDKDLTSLLSDRRNWEKSILVIEDADAASSATWSREGEAGEKVGKMTLSALLNVLDGLLTPDGLVVIATTNYPDRLDPALVRPGRFDLQYDIGLLSLETFEKMASLFDVPLDEDIKALFVPTTGVLLRKCLIDRDLNTLKDHFRKERRNQMTEVKEAG